MKKILLLFIFVIGALTCSAQKSKSFYYDGIEIHNVKGWTIVPTKEGDKTVINCIKLPAQLTFTKQAALENKSLEVYLSQMVERLMETSMATSGKAPMIKEMSPVMDGYVNAMPAKYIDVTYTKKVRQRIYALNAYNYMITVTCTGIGGAHDAFVEKSFGKILSTFAFNPETNSYDLFH